ncbi:MAG: hypothetical protein QF541_21105 [Lentisphaeria bacterium]|nr:hypothetical protein [Lentisphaeria bacterium]
MGKRAIFDLALWLTPGRPESKTVCLEGISMDPNFVILRRGPGVEDIHNT